MTEIVALLHGIDQSILDRTTRRRLVLVVLAILAMAGRVTMLGIARWTEAGGSYRTVQRLFNTPIDWSRLMVTCVALWFADEESVFLLAGDETVVTKAGKQTHGLDRYYASIYGKVVKGLAFMAFSLISVQKQTAYPVRMEQITRGQALCGRRPTQAKAQAKKKKHSKPGRPQGSKNKNRRDVELPPHLQQIQEWLQATLRLLRLVDISVTYFVFDGAFGNNNSLQMVQRCGLHLISKLRRDATLYFPYAGEQKKRGARRKYGDRLNYDQLPAAYLVSMETEGPIQTETYQMTMRHELFPDLLNIVVVVKTHLVTGRRAHIVLFSSDLTLTADRIVSYYRLRFQIEFNFRAAKQFWGLEDFMNVKEQPVTNCANLAMWMVSVSQKLIQQRRRHLAAFGLHDLKAEFRGRKYASELFKLLPEKPNELLIDQFFARITALGGVHAPVDT
jgi:putative transposase